MTNEQATAYLMRDGNYPVLEGCAVCGTEDAGRIDPDQSLDICIDCLHAGAERIRIESHEREGGLRSIKPGMPDAADALRETLRSMEALLRVARGEGSTADVAHLGINWDADPMDAVSEWVDSWALSIDASENRTYVLLGYGGPTVELDILTVPGSGRVEEVILRRAWSSARDRAWTDDPCALDIVGDFLHLIGR